LLSISIFKHFHAYVSHMRQIKLPGQNKPGQPVPEREPRFRSMKVLEDKGRARLRRQLFHVQDEIHALDRKRILILQQKEWAAAERDDVFELTQPPPLKGLGHEVSLSLMKIFPMCASMVAIVAGSVCDSLSRLFGSSTREDLFVGVLETVLAVSAMISAFIVKYRPTELLDDIESQIKESMGDLQKKRAMIENKLGADAGAVEKN
jgi:hypothetical protein